MIQPKTHINASPRWGDKWDPYSYRQYVAHMLSNQHFDMLMECDSRGRSLHSEDYEGHGCLDAPDEIPCGSTLVVMTIGGYEREEYNKRDRGCVDWRSDEAKIESVAKMLKELLSEVQ